MSSSSLADPSLHCCDGCSKRQDGVTEAQQALALIDEVYNKRSRMEARGGGEGLKDKESEKGRVVDKELERGEGERQGLGRK